MRITPNKPLIDFNENLEFIKEYDYDHLVDRLYVHWDLLTKCNFDCSYCHAKRQYQKLGQWNDIDIFERQLLIIKALSISTLPVFLGLQGGESTIHPYFEEIFKDLYIENCETEIQTNLTTKNVDFLIKKFDLISVSLHYKELIKVKKLDLFLENLEKVSKSNKLYVFDIMLENLGQDQKEYLEFVKSLLKYTEIAKSSEMIYAYWDNENIMNNSEVFEMNKEFYLKYNKTTKSHIWHGWSKRLNTNENWDNQESSKGLYCLGGCKKFHIFGNGDVYKCASHETQAIKDFNKVKEDGISKPLGNILEDYDSIFELTKSYKKCEFNYCGGDFYVPRAISELQLKLLEKEYDKKNGFTSYNERN